jgi:glycosyltransferase involved in cell wall biosynthesis
MRLLIISHTRHYLQQGKLLGWGPTIEEVDWLARVFDHVIHLACLHSQPPPKSAQAYRNHRVTVTSVPPSGGLGWKEKTRVITLAPRYIQAIVHWLPFADVVHIRAPCPIALYAMLLLSVRSSPIRWTKYAGNWGETNLLPPSFAFQRWWLRMGFGRGPVTVNGRWENQPKHIFSFDNPAFSLEEVRRARSQSVAKLLAQPVRLVFAGRLEKAKGIYTILQVMKALNDKIEAHLDVLGDGPERQKAAIMCEDLGIREKVVFHGWLSREEVKRFLARAHFVVLPSQSEGFPKVLSEGMCYGAVPLASNISAISQLLNETNAGVSLNPDDINGFVSAILTLVDEPQRWKQMCLAGMRAATRFCYERYIVALDDMFKIYYGSSPLDRNQVEMMKEGVASEEESITF